MPARRAAKPKSKPKPRHASALAVSGDCGLAQAEALKSRLAAAVAQAAPVTLDLGGLTRMDTPGLQLLLAFVRDRQAQGRAVVWQGIPRWFEDAAQRLGLTAALGVIRA